MGQQGADVDASTRWSHGLTATSTLALDMHIVDFSSDASVQIGC